MRRLAFSVIAVLFVMSIAGYSAGVFTGETRTEESCPLCRATRYSGTHYGFHYEYVEDNQLSRWYRQNIDPMHGLDPDHPHHWRQSGCTVNIQPGIGDPDYICTWVPPVFLIRPEVELEALKRIPDKATQIGLIQSLNTPSRRTNSRRIRLLIEYYYVNKDTTPWPQWWKQHAAEFGMQPLPGS